MHWNEKIFVLFELQRRAVNLVKETNGKLRKIVEE